MKAIIMMIRTLNHIHFVAIERDGINQIYRGKGFHGFFIPSLKKRGFVLFGAGNLPLTGLFLALRQVERLLTGTG